MIVKFSNKEIPKSPYTVQVEGAAGDPTKVTAAGPGIEKTGVIAGKKTYFEVYTHCKICLICFLFSSQSTSSFLSYHMNKSAVI